MAKPKLVEKVTTAIKRQASSIASRVKKKRKSGSETGSTISVESSSKSSTAPTTRSRYRSPTVEDAEDEGDQVARGSTAAPDDGDEIEEIPAPKKGRCLAIHAD